MREGVLYGVSVGPGDPELLTLKAVRVIREADVVAVPDCGGKRQMAYAIAFEYLVGKQVLDCQTHMTGNRVAANESYTRIADDICALLDEGKSVAYLSLGDVSIYSTFAYVQRIVRERGYETEIIPGVASFCAAAARLGEPLCEGSECLVVAPPFSPYIDQVLELPATKVFMKSGRQLNVLRDTLGKRGELEHASMVANCGLPDERVYPRFADAEAPAGYFAVVIAKKTDGQK
ncbi:MAG: precorrin-2 C(20)-methyltransferase [Coriobacteriia bacterium]|nr:precorrin-2 C(20)-methyltransferase [Coriobacteriia bacterium]